MKIISKFKDYYDYLIGIYGEDPLIRLNRLDSEGLPIPSETNPVFKLIIAGEVIEGILHDGKFYYGESIFDVTREPSEYELKWGKANNTGAYYINDHGSWYVSSMIYKDTQKYNDKLDCPILYCEMPKRNQNIIMVKNPRLSDYNLATFISPTVIYQKLSSYLSSRYDDNLNKIVDVENDTKISSKGFDIKTSFRPNMK